MKKEDISLIAQLLAGMKDAVDKMESSYKKNDAERFASLRKEVLTFQMEIKKLL
jgi:hypothetical protein